MKLSQIEAVVAAIRARANEMGVTDPNIKLFANDLDGFLEIEASPETVKHYMQPCGTDLEGEEKTERGDACLYLKRV